MQLLWLTLSLFALGSLSLGGASCTGDISSDPDGGSLAREPESNTECVDGGECDAPPDPQVIADACASLVVEACGAGEGPSCEDSTACYAAQLLAQYEPTTCLDALDDDARFPECGFSACETLVLQVCGGLDEQAPCADAAGCAPSKTLLERSEQNDDASLAAEALQSCRAGLEDDVVFSVCSQGEGT